MALRLAKYNPAEVIEEHRKLCTSIAHWQRPSGISVLLDQLKADYNYSVQHEFNLKPTTVKALAQAMVNHRSNPTQSKACFETLKLQSQLASVGDCKLLTEVPGAVDAVIEHTAGHPTPYLWFVHCHHPKEACLILDGLAACANDTSSGYINYNHSHSTPQTPSILDILNTILSNTPATEPKHALALAILCWADMRTGASSSSSAPSHHTSHGRELLHLLTSTDHAACLSGIRAAAILAALVRNKETNTRTDPDGFFCFSQYAKVTFTSQLTEQVITALISHSRSTSQPDVALHSFRTLSILARTRAGYNLIMSHLPTDPTLPDRFQPAAYPNITAQSSSALSSARTGFQPDYPGLFICLRMPDALMRAQASALLQQLCKSSRYGLPPADCFQQLLQLLEDEELPLPTAGSVAEVMTMWFDPAKPSTVDEDIKAREASSRYGSIDRSTEFLEMKASQLGDTLHMLPFHIARASSEASALHDCSPAGIM
jgi:hypothetical protein